MASNSSVEEAFEKVKHLFGVERLKTEQLSILTSIIGGEDCVAVLPTALHHQLTGCGKLRFDWLKEFLVLRHRT
jgi:hypothetical protein